MLETEFRNNIRFGFGTYHKRPNGQLSDDELLAQVRDLTWSSGCPKRIDAVTPREDLLTLGRRYFHVNSMFDLINREVFWHQNYSEFSLTELRLRLKYEYLAQDAYDLESVPGILYSTAMYPLNYPPNFALPRVALEFIGDSDKDAKRKGLDVVRRIVIEKTDQVSSPSQLLVTVANGLVRSWGRPWGKDNILKILAQVFRQSLLDEQNCPSVFQEIADDMNYLTPDLLREYLGLTPQEKRQWGIIETI